MSNRTAAAVHWVEQGRVPDRVVRLGIQRLLKARLAELHDDDAAATAALAEAFVDAMRVAPIAPRAEKANEQHYELPAAFFAAVLGPHRKYSSCFWPGPEATLEQAEAAALQTTCERADLIDGQRVLELGCGWGSLTLWIAARYPASRITAVSNSHSQRRFIEREAARLELVNVEVLTRDMNDFDIAARFDRVISVEMFEHLHNWPRAFANVARWLAPHGRFFMHVFAHRGAPYAFVERDASDWMSRYFFSGGLMPSDDLALRFQDDLRVVERWRWDGTHYQRTAEAWLRNMDRQRAALAPLFTTIYGDQADLWWMRWRLFFMSVAELFGFAGGQQWWVSHTLFEARLTTPLWPVALTALAVVSLLSLATWVASVARHDASLVDRMWPAFIAAAALVCWARLPSSGTRGAVMLGLVLAWALRLAVYITRRNWGHGEDRRYQAIRARNEPNFALKSLYLVFALQAMLAVVVAAPFLAGMAASAPFGALDALGAAIAAFGIVFEAVGDAQMSRFKADGANRGRVMDRGLWRFTRHPNYFGEACLWWGLALMALAGAGLGGAWCLVSPLLMTVLLLKVSGVSLLEADIAERRPAYRDYVARTPAFFPGRPRAPR